MNNEQNHVNTETKKKLLSLYIHNSALVFYIMWYIWNKGFWSIWAFIRNLYFSLGRLRFLGTRFPGSLVVTLFLSRFHFVGILLVFLFLFQCDLVILRLLNRYFFLKYKEGRFFLEPSVYICWLRRGSCFRHFCFCLYIFVLMCRSEKYVKNENNIKYFFSSRYVSKLESNQYSTLQIKFLK